MKGKYPSLVKVVLVFMVPLFSSFRKISVAPYKENDTMFAWLWKRIVFELIEHYSYNQAKKNTRMVGMLKEQDDFIDYYNCYGNQFLQNRCDRRPNESLSYSNEGLGLIEWVVWRMDNETRVMETIACLLGYLFAIWQCVVIKCC